MKLTLSIKQSLVLFALAALLLLSAVAGTGYWITNTLTGQISKMAQESAGLKNQMVVDMTHDAIHSDVFVAMYIGQQQDEEMEGVVRDDLAEHIAEQRQAFADNLAFSHGEAIDAKLQEVKSLLEKYQQDAEVLVKEALDSNGQVDPLKVMMFVKAFRDLEGPLGEIDTMMLDAVLKAEQDGKQSATMATRAVAVAFVLSLVVLLLLTLQILRSVFRKKKKSEK